MHLATRFLLLGLTVGLLAVGIDAQDRTSRGPRQQLVAERAELVGAVPVIDGYHIVLITADGLEPEALGCYGNPRTNVSPSIDELASTGFRFDAAYAMSTNRIDGALTVGYSVMPSTLRAIGGTTSIASFGTQLADRGFRIHAVSSLNSFEGVETRYREHDPSLGFAKRLSRTRSPGSMEQYIRRRLGGRRDQPYFLWVHAEYPWPPTYHPGFDYGRAPAERYDAATSCVDHVVRLVRKALIDHEIGAQTIIVVAGATARPSSKAGDDPLSEKSLRVPLIVNVPGLDGGIVREPVSTLDIVPTLASLIGRSVDYSVQGRSFLGLLLPEARKNERWRSLTAISERVDPVTGGEQLSARRDRWRLIYEPRLGKKTLLDVTARDDVNHASEQPAVVGELLTKIEELAIFGEACANAWQQSDPRSPIIDGSDGPIARALWLVRYEPQRARELVLQILSDESTRTFQALELLFKCGKPEDVGVAARYLESSDYRISSLAGAYVALHDDVDRGLDHALQGLRPETSPSALSILFDTLARTKSPRALEAVRQFDIELEDEQLEAERVLTLARLGDPAGLAQLPRYILEPRVAYDKEPFVRRLLEHRGNDAAAILRLALTDGDRQAGTVLAAFSGLETVGTREDGPAVAEYISHSDERVRQVARRLLAKWESAAGYTGWMRWLNLDAKNVTSGVRGLLAIPGLLGSPLLPGVRLDHAVLNNPPPKLKLSRGRPRIERHLELTVRAPHTEFRRCALYVTIPPESREAAGKELQLRVWINTRFVSQIDFHRDDESALWVGRLRAGLLESGLNELRVSATTGDGSVAIEGVAFALLPDEAADFVALTGLEVQSGDPRLKIRATTPLPLSRDVSEHRIYFSAAGQLPPKTTPTLLRILADDRVLHEIRLPRRGGAGDRRLTLPSRAWNMDRLRLAVVHEAGNNPPQRVAAFVYGVPPVPDAK